MHALDHLHLHRAAWATLVAAVAAIICTLALASSVNGAGSQTAPVVGLAGNGSGPTAQLLQASPPWAAGRVAQPLTWRLGTTLPTLGRHS